jgi:hypothetical protein
MEQEQFQKLVLDKLAQYDKPFMVSRAGGVKRYFVYILKQLQIKEMSFNALNDISFLLA